MKHFLDRISLISLLICSCAPHGAKHDQQPEQQQSDTCGKSGGLAFKSLETKEQILEWTINNHEALGRMPAAEIKALWVCSETTKLDGKVGS